MQGFSSVASTQACRCVEAASVAEALSLLHLAQRNSSNWISDRHGHLGPLPNRAHLFVRVVLYDTVKQQMGTMHVIDLAGSQSLAGSHADGQRHQEKLAINQQLLSLSIVVSELSRLSTSKGMTAFTQPACIVTDETEFVWHRLHFCQLYQLCH